eukprot:ANDGO_02558.mRNA.1 hypothetical protein
MDVTKTDSWGREGAVEDFATEEIVKDSRPRNFRRGAGHSRNQRGSCRYKPRKTHSNFHQPPSYTWDFACAKVSSIWKSAFAKEEIRDYFASH